MEEVNRQLETIKYEASCGGSISQLKFLLQKQVDQLNKLKEKYEKGQKAITSLLGEQHQKEVKLKELVLKQGRNYRCTKSGTG